ncbi:tRNA-specific adenosine deaminase [Enterococcus saigonensis]|uniref:tRNA-specific adenosine deaminase n=1 Tax=Enterococcus saigonensis TaxID=1805431 RepID=A0A679IGN1_9ENTE|nr:tRNA-specific adenosine deaminase [Enterococcus saigonensis]
MKKSSTLDTRAKEKYMLLALEQAKKAQAIGEVPIGAVVILDGEVIGCGYNRREADQDATAHAEMLAIREACQNVDSWRLERSQLFVTLEPCPMCSGAMQLARVEEVYFGAYDPKGGAAGSLLTILTDERFNHWSYVEGGILQGDCSQILTDFFRELRAKRKAEKKLRQRTSEAEFE